MSTANGPRAGALGRRAAAIGAFLVLLLAVYADPLFFRRNFAGRDLAVYNYPMEKAVHDAFSRGRLPVWDPYVSGGRPLLSNPNTGAFYPIRPLLSLVGFPEAMRLYPILHWAAAGIGTILLLDALGATAAASLVGACTYVFSGVVVSQVFYTNLHPGVALLPWAIGILAHRATRRFARVAGLSAVFGLLFLAGDVFTSAIAALAALLWVQTESAPPRRAAWEDVAAAVLLGALLAAPQILATALVIPETQRAVGHMRLAETLRFSLAPARLLELVVPYPFGATWSLDPSAIWRPSMRFYFATVFCGAFSVVAFADVARRPGSTPGARFARALAIAGGLLAIVPGLIPAGLRGGASPLPLRYPEKFSIALVLGLAVCAGIAFDRFRSSPVPKWVLPLCAALAALATAAALVPAVPDAAAALLDGSAGAARRELPGALAEAGLAWTATFVALELLRGSRRARVAALLLLLAVPVAANRRIARVEREESVFAPTPFLRAAARRDPRGADRLLDESVFLPDTALSPVINGADPGALDYVRRIGYLPSQALWHRGTVFNADLDAGDLSRMESLRRISTAAAGWPNASDFFARFALRFGLRWKDTHPLPGYAPFGGDGLQGWDENRAALPDVRLATRWRETPGAIEALAALRGAAAGEMVVESGRAAAGSARLGSIRVLEDRPERLRLRVAAADPGWLFVLRGFWTFRTVLVNGREIPTVPAEIAFSALPVPAGESEIDWRERVPGGSVSWAGPILYLLGIAWLGTRARSGAPADAVPRRRR